MPEFKIESDAMNAIVTKAILDGIGQEQRDLVIEQAVKHLVAVPPKDRNNYYAPDPVSPIQQAFNNALNQTVMAVAREVVTDNAELQQRVRDLVSQAVADVLATDEYGPLAQAVRKTFATTLAEFRSKDYS